MDLDVLVSELHQPSRVNKLRVIQILAQDLATEETHFFQSGAEYEVWSPFDSSGAAQTLLQMLEIEPRRACILKITTHRKI